MPLNSGGARSSAKFASRNKSSMGLISSIRNFLTGTPKKVGGAAAGAHMSPDRYKKKKGGAKSVKPR